MGVELRQLRYFVAVAEERHFGHAAVRLGIAQPGLSQQIKSLERAIGVQLLERDKRHVEMTSAGEAFLYYARLAIELAERAGESARTAALGKTGLLRVGTRALGVPPIAEELLRQFGARFPEVDVDLRPGLVRQSIERLTSREVDVAIVLSPFDAPPDSHYLRLGALEALIVLPLGHRLASLDRIPRSELFSETFLGLPRSFNPVFVDHLNEMLFGQTRHDRLIEVSDLNETGRLCRVAAGEGISVVDPSVLSLGISEVEFRRLEDPAPEIEYGIVWLDSSASPFVASFVELADRLAAPAGAPEATVGLVTEQTTEQPRD
jgi:DNA-binding transcriptional LysR family regulator